MNRWKSTEVGVPFNRQALQCGSVELPADRGSDQTGEIVTRAGLQIVLVSLVENTVLMIVIIRRTGVGFYANGLGYRFV